MVLVCIHHTYHRRLLIYKEQQSAYIYLIARIATRAVYRSLQSTHKNLGHPTPFYERLWRLGKMTGRDSSYGAKVTFPDVELQCTR